MTNLSPVEILVKPVSADCNLDCTYCFYLSKSLLYPEEKIHRMKEDVLEKFIASFIKFSRGRPCSFCWQGGEPTLRGIDFYEKAVSFMQKYGFPGQIMSNAFQTNNLLLNEEWAKFFKEYNFLVGVSVDGPDYLHNIYRKDKTGKGSFNGVFNNIQYLKKCEVEFNILIVINNENVRKPSRIYEFFVSQGLFYLQFVPCVGKDPNESIACYSVKPEDFGNFLCSTFELWVKDFPKVYIRLFNDILMSYLDGGEPPVCVFRKKCGKYIVMEYNGDVYPCDFFVEPEWKLGNVMQSSLREMLNSPKEKDFIFRKEDLSPDCLKCRWQSLCYGDCPKYRLMNGGINRPSYLCPAYKTFFEYSERKYLGLAKKIKK